MYLINNPDYKQYFLITNITISHNNEDIDLIINLIYLLFGKIQILYFCHFFSVLSFIPHFPHFPAPEYQSTSQYL